MLGALQATLERFSTHPTSHESWVPPSLITVSIGALSIRWAQLPSFAYYVRTYAGAFDMVLSITGQGTPTQTNPVPNRANSLAWRLE